MIEEIKEFMTVASVHSPKIYINKNNELIVVPSKNIYFRLADVNNELVLKTKIFSWLSRSACKGVGKYWESRMRKIINEYLKTDFSKQDFDLIYTRLGNDVNRELCHSFINSNYDLSLLES